MTPPIANMNEISIVRPMRIRYDVSPVTVHSAARSVKCRTSELAISLIQSASHSATPANTMSKRRRSTSFAYT
jgi:hypothetical protein